jgi:hypothetical protein
MPHWEIKHLSSFKKTADLLLELVPDPQSPVVEIAPRQRLFYEGSSVKEPAIGLKPQVMIGLPLDLRARPVSDESCTTVVCGPDQKSRYSIHAIFKTLPPLKNPIGKDRHTVGSLKLDLWMNVHEI